MPWTLCGNNNFFTQVCKRVSHYFHAMIKQRHVCLYIYMLFFWKQHRNWQLAVIIGICNGVQFCVCVRIIFSWFLSMVETCCVWKNQSQKNTHVFFPDKQWVHTKGQSLQTIPKKVLQNETRAVKFGVAFPPKQWFREMSMHCWSVFGAYDSMICNHDQTTNHVSWTIWNIPNK